MSGPEVVARRFDQLAGRLGTLANAMAVADLYGWRFGFVWPPSRDDSVSHPLQLFAPSFLAEHGLEESDLDGRTAIPCGDMSTAFVVLDDLVTFHAEQSPFFDVPGPFELLTAQVEDEDLARVRLRRAFDEVVWADELRPVIEFCRTWTRGERWTGVHVRAGDTIVGPWRNGMWHEKYLPTSCLAAALAECRQEGSPVLLCSDHPRYAAWLRSRYGDVRLAGDVFPGFDGLTEVQRAFAEILLLSTCDRIVGPPRSAFSGFAAMLGCGTVTRCDELCPESTDRSPLEASLDAVEAAGSDRPFLLPFVARDACWWADVYADELEAGEMLGALRRATRADPAFAAAWARRARTAGRLGRAAEARRAVRRAEELAVVDPRHDDPMVDALAARVVVEACRAVGPWRWLVPGGVAQNLRRASDAVDECRIREPFVIRLPQLVADLDALVATAGRLAALPAGRRPAVGRRLRAVLRRPLSDDARVTGAPRSTRRALHRSSASFDPVPEDVEAIRSRFDQALATSLGVSIHPATDS